MKPTKFMSAAAAVAIAFAFAGTASAQVAKPYFEFKQPKTTLIPGDLSTDTNGAVVPVSNAASIVSLGFEGVSQYDGAAFARNFIPPDTMGAVGRTQYVETTNGAYAIFDKNTGARLSLTSDVAFWAAAGQTGANGDTRIMYNAAASRWVAVAFGANVADLQIAVSDSDNALGSWQSVKFTGFAGGTADYPTLALDSNAVYIGTNNFKVGCSAANPSANAFCGTTLNVIPLNSLFGAGAPTVDNMKQFVTPYDATVNTNVDRGFALQGVNSSTVSGSGTVIAASLFVEDVVAYKVNGLTASSALGSTESGVTLLGQAGYTFAGPARQPSAAIAANRRIISTLDERISSSVYEANGLIYMVQTVNSGLDTLDEARIRYTVIDKNTYAIVDQGDIGGAGYDYYQGSIAVNALGQVVIGYNRSGLDAATGKISIMARIFTTGADGKLTQQGDELFLKESLTDDYHNGSIFGQAAVGRQRWGDYSQVSIDPTDQMQFYLIGEFAREYNLPQFGHPGGTGGSRWSTFISRINVAAAVPESSTWTMMIAGFGLVGWSTRRRRTRVTFQMV